MNALMNLRGGELTKDSTVGVKSLQMIAQEEGEQNHLRLYARLLKHHCAVCTVRYCDKTSHNTTFKSLNVALLNVIVSKRKHHKT
jgi:hypothetical protein